jgi:hypothetical protein
MTKFSTNNKRPSTIKRADEVCREYDALAIELGDLITVVSKSYIYERISDTTGLCAKTIAAILNHAESLRKSS